MLWVWFDLSPAYLTGTFGVSSYSVFCSRIDWESFSDLSVHQTCSRDKPNVYHVTKSSLSKSMQPSIPPIGWRWTFSMSQVDLTHNDDYVVTIVNIINITTIVFISMQ